MCGTWNEKRQRLPPQKESLYYPAKVAHVHVKPLHGDGVLSEKQIESEPAQSRTEEKVRITSNGESVGLERRPLLVDEWTQADVLKFLSAAFSSFEQWPRKILPKLVSGLKTRGKSLDGRYFVNLTVKALRAQTRINKDWCRYIIRLRDDLVYSIQLKNEDAINQDDEVCMDARRECARLQETADRIHAHTRDTDQKMSSDLASGADQMELSTPQSSSKLFVPPQGSESGDGTTAMSCRTSATQSMTLSSSTLTKPRRKSKYKLRLQDYPDWMATPFDNPSEFRFATLFTFDPNKEQWIRRDLECYIDSSKFDEGGMRSVYYMYEVDRGQKLSDGQTDCVTIHIAKKFKQKRISHQAYFDEVLTQTVAESYAQQFNRICKKKVSFLPASVMQLQDNKELFNVEPCLLGKYEKFSDNFGYVKRTNFKQPKYQNIPKNIKYYRQTIEAVAQTFSHFTYETSNHLLVVVDIQGVGSYYTDPQIHTYDGSGFGLGNFGAKGLKEFLLSHKCNKICKACKLTDYTRLAANIRANEALPKCQRVPLEHLLAPERFKTGKTPRGLQKTTKKRSRLHTFTYSLLTNVSELRYHLREHPDIAKKARADIVHMCKVQETQRVSRHYSSMAKAALNLVNRLTAGSDIYENELKKLEPQISFLRQLILGVERDAAIDQERKTAAVHPLQLRNVNGGYPRQMGGATSPQPDEPNLAPHLLVEVPKGIGKPPTEIQKGESSGCGEKSAEQLLAAEAVDNPSDAPR